MNKLTQEDLKIISTILSQARHKISAKVLLKASPKGIAYLKKITSIRDKVDSLCVEKFKGNQK